MARPCARADARRLVAGSGRHSFHHGCAGKRERGRDRGRMALPLAEARRHDAGDGLFAGSAAASGIRAAELRFEKITGYAAHVRHALSRRQRLFLSRRVLGEGRTAASLFRQRRVGRRQPHAGRPGRLPRDPRRRPRAHRDPVPDPGIGLRRDRTARVDNLEAAFYIAAHTRVLCQRLSPSTDCPFPTG